MLCRKCNTVVDRLERRWWERLLFGSKRYFCAKCHRTFLAW
jgi:hypothetical protein